MNPYCSTTINICNSCLMIYWYSIKVIVTPANRIGRGRGIPCCRCSRCFTASSIIYRRSICGCVTAISIICCRRNSTVSPLLYLAVFPLAVSSVVASICSCVSASSICRRRSVPVVVSVDSLLEAHSNE